MLKNLPSGVIEGYVDELTVEAIIECVSQLSAERFMQTGRSSIEVWFSVQEGNEVALSNEFPEQDLLKEVRSTIMGKQMGDVATHLLSWQDPACEVEQGAWCIGIKV